MMWESATGSGSVIEPWSVVRWTSLNLILFWALSFAAGNSTGMFGGLLFLVLGPPYVIICLAITSAVAALQVRRARLVIPVQWWLLVAVVTAQAVFVYDVWQGYPLPVWASTLLTWVSVGSAPAAAMLHLGLARRPRQIQR